MGITAINGIPITSSATDTIGISNTTTGVGPYYLVFVDSTSGYRTPLVDSSTLTYNSTTNTLTTTTFAGSLTGTASWATSASRAITSSNADTATQLITRVVPFGSTFYPPFVQDNNASDIAEVYYTHPSYSFNSSTAELKANLINITGSGMNSSTADANLTIDASVTQSMTWIASFTTTRSLIINNLTPGRSVDVYIRNTNATQRQIIFSGSTSTTGHVLINMATPFLNGASTTTQNITAVSGTMYPRIKNIAGTIIGGL